MIVVNELTFSNLKLLSFKLQSKTESTSADKWVADYVTTPAACVQCCYTEWGLLQQDVSLWMREGLSLGTKHFISHSTRKHHLSWR